MTDQNPTQQPAAETQSEEAPKVVQLSRWQQFTLDHPRLSKGIAIGGVVGTALGASLAVNNVRKNKHHIDAAQDHLALAAGEFTEAVSPTSENTDA